MNLLRKHLDMVPMAYMLCVLEILVTSLIAIAAADCHSAEAALLKLVLQSQRNATGHRVIRVHLHSRATPGGGAADLGAVEAWQTVRTCDGAGVEVFETVAVVTAPPARVRLPGYEVFPGMGYYKFHTQSATWGEAYSACVSEGAHLLFIASDAEADVVKQFFGRKRPVEGAPTWTGWAWAGFHDRGVEGDYRTVLGDPLNETGYIKWHPGQPDNTPWGNEPDQDCGSFNKDALLNDLPCVAKLAFICKQPL